jgi:NAD+ synthase (glutamine-hydrolysing)
MYPKLRVALAQLNFTVGDIDGNTSKIIKAIQTARDEQKADLIIFPELAVTGYPLEDLLHRPHLYQQTAEALNTIGQHVKDIDVVLGYPKKTKEGCFNTAGWIRNQKFITEYYKQKLPNYSVFDELRYFNPGTTPSVIEINGFRFGLLICEDLWHTEPVKQAKEAGAQFLVCINASPYSIHKETTRHEIFEKRIRESNLPIFYVNLIGGQDELVFDGNSTVIGHSNEICAKAKSFEEDILYVDIDSSGKIVQQSVRKQPTQLETIYHALILGLKDYVKKNGFPGVIIGLSGGIDSALTLAIAVDALGAEHVTALLMPSQYNSSISLEDAKKQAETMGVQYHIISIEKLFDSFNTTLAPIFKGLKTDTTEENLQARIRGTLQMAISNKSGNMVLTTGNKSEMAVGYATLYGDMAGGFCMLKDIFKTLVYQLANYRNAISPVIPQRVIDRPPSAELAPDQKDRDSLPPYDILDGILKMFIEEDKDIDDIIKEGFDKNTVIKVIKMVLRNEYKRRQAAPGIRISEKAFGRDRRYPITSGYLKNVEALSK